MHLLIHNSLKDGGGGKDTGQIGPAWKEWKERLLVKADDWGGKTKTERVSKQNYETNER